MASYNFISYNSNVSIDDSCMYDTNVGYESNFSVNGNVDLWDYYSGIHSYGCWNNFLFGTLYSDYAVIGRNTPFAYVDAEVYYQVSISLLIQLVPRTAPQATPMLGKLMWTTVADGSWNDDKSTTFEIYPDSDWHTYIIDMSPFPKWIGYVNNLRIYSILNGGRDGDEFFIRSIKISSISNFICKNTGCSYSLSYSHPCPGMGVRPACESTYIDASEFTIEKDVNDSLIININGYGYETIKIDPIEKISTRLLAKKLTGAIGTVNVGGYAEAEVLFTESGTFKLYSGTYLADGGIVLNYTKLAEQLGFFNSNEERLYTFSAGVDPVSGYKPLCSYKVTPSTLLELCDKSINSYIEFDPSIYNVEGGRRDYFKVQQSVFDRNLHGSSSDGSGLIRREYYTLNGVGKTFIDFNHPFNASGRINKIIFCGTCDYGWTTVTYGGQLSSQAYDAGRLFTTGAKALIFRPLSDGTMWLVHSIDIPDRKDPKLTLYSTQQSIIEFDCDIFVSKGDLLGVYNVNMFLGDSVTTEYINATYYRIDGLFTVGDIIDPGPTQGHGSSGLLMYARSDQKQTRIALDIDLNSRINIENITVRGDVVSHDIEYNIMRCLDINWDVNLFGCKHNTGYVDRLHSAIFRSFTITNTYYGYDNLTDGVYIVNNGQAGDGYTLTSDSVGVVPINPTYFFVNGDEEWLKIFYFPEWWKDNAVVWNFDDDPIAFTVYFPFGKSKKIFKSVVYFKERYNFRSFALSFYMGPTYTWGDADQPNFKLIPEYTAVTLDGLRYSKDMSLYTSVDKYLFVNPTVGHTISETTGGPGKEYPGDAEIPGGWTFTQYGYLTNAEQIDEASRLDWQTLTHEWTPTNAYGFRFYCMHHHSTKICEMELYGYLEGGNSRISSGVEILRSYYGDDWIKESIQEDSDGNAVCYVNDSIQYVKMEIAPLNTINLSDLLLEVSDSDLFFGEKGCEDSIYLVDNALTECNESQIVNIKNVYGDNYTAYIDIAKSSDYEKRMLYYSKLNNAESISSPTVGPSAIYRDNYDYLLTNVNKNVAINCPVYGLNNLLIGKKAYYSYDDGYTWYAFNSGNALTSDFINLQNLSSTSYSVLHIPVLSRSKYWRIAVTCIHNVFKIREIKVYRGDEELQVKVYHDKDADVNYTPATREAPHLLNKSVIGSYYFLKDKYYITIELDDVNYIDKIVIFHDDVLDYTNASSSNYFCGVDKYTRLYLVDDKVNNSIYDYSYYENEITYNEVNVNIDTNTYYETIDVVYDFENNPQCIEDLSLVDSTTTYLSYFDYINPSGTLVSGTYQYPGYVDFLVEVERLPVVWSSNLKEDTDRFCSYPSFPNAPFNMYFKMSFSSLSAYGVMCGFLNDKDRTGDYPTGFYEGPQVKITSSGFTIGVMNHVKSSYSATASYSVQLDLIYYIKLSYDGVTNYVLEVWTDAFDGSTLVATTSLSTNCSWQAERFGIGNTLKNSGSATASGRVYYLRLESQFDQTADFNNLWDSSIRFLGTENSYLSVAYDDWFNLDNKRFDFEFFFKFDELPKATYDASAYGHCVYSYNISTNETHGRFSWDGYFNGSTSYLYICNAELFNFSDQNFTIDTFITLTGYATASKVTLLYRQDSYHFYFNHTTGMLSFDGYQDGAVSSNVSVATTWSPVLNVPYHIACSRAFDQLFLFVDGEQIGVATISGSIDFPFDMRHTSDYNIYVGATCNKGTVTNPLKGYLEDFRITKGYARWSSDYTVPLIPSAPDEYTLLIARFKRDYVVMMENFNYASDVSNDYKAWSLRAKETLGRTELLLVYNSSLTRTFSLGSYYTRIKTNVWYNVFLMHGYYSYTTRTSALTINGVSGVAATEGNASLNIVPGYNNLVIGKYFKGNLKYLRISTTNTGETSDFEGIRSRIPSEAPPIPFYGFGRLYSFSVYVSDDNIIYGKHSNIDLKLESKYSSFNFDNIFSGCYNTLFAVDLEKRYALDLVRHYGASTLSDISLGENIVYLKADSNSITESFVPYTDTNESFVGFNYSKPTNFTIVDTSYSKCYIYTNKLFMEVEHNTSSEQTCKVVADYIVGADFDFQFDYQLITNITDNWTFEFRIENINNTNEMISFERGVIGGLHKYRVRRQDSWYTSYNTVYDKGTNDSIKTIRVVRQNDFFDFYKKSTDETDWTYMCSFSIDSNFWRYSRLVFELKSQSGTYPTVSLFLDNVLLNFGVAYYSNYRNARWLIINLLNGDGVNRSINKIGIYSDVHTLTAPGGGYNNEWALLGTGLTSYTYDTNLAYKATVSGSSYCPIMPFDNLTNGDKTYSTESAWGSGPEDAPYIIIDLGDVYSIYRVKVHHGLYSNYPKYIISDYKVYYSSDGINYTLLATVTNNTSWEKTHDAYPQVNARWIKITISKYDSYTLTLTDDDGDYYNFSGAILREVEVFQYKGFSVLSSESYPIVALNLKDQFYLSSDNEATGIDYENNTTNWDITGSAITFSDNIFSEPYKITFREWGSSPSYDQWVVIKKDTATGYNSGPDYVKKFIIRSSMSYNPVEQPWWWGSTVSSLSSCYNYNFDVVVAGLQIDYGNSTSIDTISFIEGDNFGADSTCSWRDAFSFKLHINDINTLDCSFGYIYFGGKDSTTSCRPVVYKWNISSISGSLVSGWNTIFLRFKTADDVDYTSYEDDRFVTEDTRNVRKITFGTVGMVYRGTGHGNLSMIIDGMYIARNRFSDYMLDDVGVYLTENAYLILPFSDFKLSSGAIAFWLRPDYDWAGRDIYNTSRIRNIFHISNVANDVFGCYFNNEGLVFYAGNVVDSLWTFTIPPSAVDMVPDSLFHIGISFSSSGSYLDVDNSTVKVFINNKVCVSVNHAWSYSDSKYFRFTLGGRNVALLTSQEAQNYSSVDGVVSDLKIYNYCKTDFSDAMNTYANVDRSVLYDSGDFIEISKDNLTFYKIGSPDLPLIYKNVNYLEQIPVYIRSNFDGKILTGKEIRTAGLIVQWDIPI